ncbi:UDP-galactopyranose mutase [Ammoniphilus sp. CFH 90114]|uniref:UDP-galactopyranose mutase n=1 Tax=Ammoniphilus sp. CFH 90114 TaxID=2493665 RepID=UPI00100DDCE7|nr:UDP-galactopyranose mutase [Ammoniphilus sp. CFH 90114]RXT04464.1 UDP-galactopyranose mutase [Ammoniphilus sp. CFH 90114]
MFDSIIVGAGFAGSVLAERMASELNQKVLIIEKRSHIGGNAYDTYNSHGVLVHEYGPHIFHTKVKEVWEYLSRFTDWYLYHHQVLGVIDGKQVPIPFNLETLYALLPNSLAQSLEQKLIKQFGYNVKVPILKLREAEDEDLRFLADYVYEKVFLHYTSKQWGWKPDELDPAVTGRVPVYISKDHRYFQDPYQGMPKEGYTKLFQRMLGHPNIKVLLNTDYREVLDIDYATQSIHLFGQPFYGKLIYTGKIDEFFDYRFGELPYRSLRFEFETVQKTSYQSVGTVNYPNDYSFTRITEFKHLTGQEHQATTIVREYPQAYLRDMPGQDVPYYPVPREENQQLYKQYKALAKDFKQVLFVGRLAEYRYYDMDAVVARALRLFEERVKVEL